VQSSSQIITNKPTSSFFYRPDALPVTQPTMSKHWREKYHIPWTCSPQAHPRVFQLCLWPLIAPGYFGGGLPCISSALWCQYPSFSEWPSYITGCPYVIAVLEGGVEGWDKRAAAEDKEWWSALSATTGGGVDSATKTGVEVWNIATS